MREIISNSKECDCKHNNLKVIKKEDSNEWSLIVSNKAMTYEYCNGRVYKCMDCNKKFVVENMFKLK